MDSTGTRRREGEKTMVATSDTSYTDAKGRTRWQRNDWLAERLKELGEFLIIGGYEESHAVVYKRLSYTISRYPASVERLLSEGRLAEIPDVGPTIAALIEEFNADRHVRQERGVGDLPPSVAAGCVRYPGNGGEDGAHALSRASNRQSAEIGEGAGQRSARWRQGAGEEDSGKRAGTHRSTSGH